MLAYQRPVQHVPLPACPSCGKKATDQWIAVQSNRLPDCPWYPLVFTLPDTLWPLFFLVCGVLRQSGSRSQPWGFGPVIRGRQADSPGTQALRATTQNL
ncbi:hypothetical protein GCM10009425_48090 [Pseudomonas asuensis]|uniref:Transposase zinc-binding domain-containing protein n=1 Tax=Pseudomonas asuensis TaxID=1825787 RepID=A0ABQ2H550_9PSED|nr:hypothetical protein GCM10009425_48090 [Pseudomonas asuensis]